MVDDRRRRFGSIGGACVIALAAMVAPARADEVWVAPTAQQDLGGLGIASNVIWPATAAGAVRLAWSVPENLQFFTHAKIALIPHSSGEGVLHIFVCPAEQNDPVVGNCAGPFTAAFTSVANRLVEVDISGAIGPSVGKPGVNYLAVLAYTTPTTATDHVVGLRFSYEPTVQAGVATLGANSFSGTLTAPAFAGSGASLTDVAKPTANVFTGTQTIDAGNLDLDDSTATTGNITKNGARFLHNFGENNTFLGVNAGNFAMTGPGYNTVVGFEAMFSNTSGSENNAYGLDALYRNTTGYRNTAIGNLALSNNTVGHDNVAVGWLAGSSNTGSNNIFLGSSVNGVAAESNTMYLGKVGTQTKTFISGVRGITTGAANAIPVVIDANGQLGTVSSSIRFKEDVHDMSDASRRLLQLRPVTFRYSQAYLDGAKPIQYGLIAEEVADVFPELAVRGADGQVETVHYETLNVLLVNEVQRQQQRIDALEQKLNDLLDRVTR